MRVLGKALRLFRLLKISAKKFINCLMFFIYFNLYLNRFHGSVLYTLGRDASRSRPFVFMGFFVAFHPSFITYHSAFSQAEAYEMQI
jgi:hypothetical protein